MFGLGMPEILMILAIALIVIGPKKLPDLAKTLGRALGEFKRSAQNFKRSIDIETTIKEMKDIDIPKTNLKDILKNTQTKDETGSVAKDGSEPDTSNPDDSDKEESQKNIDETREDKNSGNQNSDKTDTINSKTNKTD